MFEKHLEALKQNYFWAPKFDQLNDPCEALISLEYLQDLTDSFKKSRIKGLKSMGHSISDAAHSIAKIRDKFGIYSLSKSHSDEVMWANYADSHRGFCIEYESDYLFDSSFYDLKYHFPVIYSKSPPEMGVQDFINPSTIKILKKIGGHKSKSWKSEKEYRIITDKIGKNKYNFRSVTAIHFGIRISEENRSQLIDSLKGRGIKYYQTSLSQRKYKLEPILVEGMNSNEISYLSKLKRHSSPSSFCDYRIIEKTFHAACSKGTASLEINTILSKEEILEFGQIIKEALFDNPERLYIKFFLNNQSNRSVSWAVCNFIDKNPPFVQINNIKHLEAYS